MNDETVIDSEPTEMEAKCFTRGMNPRAAVAWVRALHGDVGVRALEDALPEWAREAIGAGLRPSLTSWVPFLAHAELLVVTDRLFGDGDYKKLIEVGRAAALRDFPFLAKPFARILSPGVFLDFSTKIWSLYMSHGNWEMSRGEREMQGVLVGWPETHPAFCMCMRGWIEGALLFSGAVAADCIEEKCAAKGATCCSIRMTWRERSDAARDRRPRAPS